MTKENIFEVLPSNYRHEKIFLSKENLNNWEILSKLTDSNLNKIIHYYPLCTESRLRKIRAIANLIIKLDITPAQAYILLHSGISTLKTLSMQNPHGLEKKIGRLQRKLNVKVVSYIDYQLLNEWINKAKVLIKVDLS